VNLHKWTQTMAGSETAVEAFMAACEAILVSLIGRVAVWLTPLPSAVLVSRSAVRVFELGGLWPWVMAGVIELIGLVTSNLWLTAKEWNRGKNKTDPQANEFLAFGLMLSYFVTTGLLLLAFEIPRVIETGNIVGLTALLFPILSAVGIISLNERILQHRRLSEKVSKRQRVKVSSKLSNNVNLDTLARARRAKKAARLNALVEFYHTNSNAGATEAAQALGVSRQTVYTYLAELEEVGRIERNGAGVQIL
jgi:hypothetical protein